MKQLSFLFSLALLAIAILSTGCTKDDDDPKTNADLILGTWKVTAFTVDPALPFIGSNVYNQIPDCSKDDLSIFESGNVYKADEGPTKCSNNDPQTILGSYTFNTDQTILTVNSGGDSFSYKIVSLSESTMSVTYTENDTGVTYTYSLTFAKQ